MYDDIGHAVHIRRRFVDHGQLVAVVIADEACCRIDDEARAADDQHVGMADVIEGLFNDIVIKAFFVEDDVRFDRAAAGVTFGYACRRMDVFGVEEFMAVLAEIAVYAAVQLEDVLAACLLVQAVDILGDDGFELAGFFQFS